MEIKCPACDSGYRVPMEKLPADKEVVAFPCPNCAHPLTINLKDHNGPNPASEIDTATEVPPETATDDNDSDQFSESYDAMEKPFDFLNEGERTALICEPNPDIKQTVRHALETLGFKCAEAESTLEALKHLRYHIFDLVIFNENFDGKVPEDNPLRIYLSRLPMATRRNIFVVLLTRRLRTLDNMAAFNLSVNLVFNEKNMTQIEPVIQRGMADNEAFYKMYHQAEASAGEGETVADRSF